MKKVYEIDSRTQKNKKYLVSFDLIKKVWHCDCIWGQTNYSILDKKPCWHIKVAREKYARGD